MLSLVRIALVLLCFFSLEAAAKQSCGSGKIIEFQKKYNSNSLVEFLKLEKDVKVFSIRVPW